MMSSSKNKNLKLLRFQLFVHYVELGVGDMAIHSAQAFGILLDLQLDSIFGVHKVCATAMHHLAGHGAHINQKAKLLFGVELLNIHVLCFMASSHMSLSSIPLLYSMLGELLIMSLTFVRSGKMYFSESFVPGACTSPGTGGGCLSLTFFGG